MASTPPPLFVVKEEAFKTFNNVDDAFLEREFEDDVSKLVIALINADVSQKDRFINETFKTFGTYHEKIEYYDGLPGENKLKVTYKASDVLQFVHIYGFLEAIYGRNMATQIYLVLKYGSGVDDYIREQKIEEFFIEGKMFGACNDPIRFFTKLLTLHEIISWERTIKCAPITQTLTIDQKNQISTNTRTFAKFIEISSSEKLNNFFEKQTSLQKGRVVQKVTFEMNKFFDCVDEQMAKHSEYYVPIMEATKQVYDARTCSLRDKHHPLSHLNVREPKRPRTE